MLYIIERPPQSARSAELALVGDAEICIERLNANIGRQIEDSEDVIVGWATSGDRDSPRSFRWPRAALRRILNRALLGIDGGMQELGAEVVLTHEGLLCRSMDENGRLLPKFTSLSPGEVAYYQARGLDVAVRSVVHEMRYQHADAHIPEVIPGGSHYQLGRIENGLYVGVVSDLATTTGLGSAALSDSAVTTRVA